MQIYEKISKTTRNMHFLPCFLATEGPSVSRMLEDEADEDEVDGYRDGIDTHGSHSGA